MKIRSLHPDFFSDAKMTALPYEARLLFAGLWCYADDYGRGRLLPKRIEGQVFPSDVVDIDRLLDLLLESGRIRAYTVDGEPFYEIPTWSEYQSPKYKAKSSIPDPSNADPGPIGTNPGRFAPDLAQVIPIPGKVVQKFPPGEGEGEGEGEVVVEGEDRQTRRRVELSAGFSTQILTHSTAFRTLRKRRNWAEFEEVLTHWIEDLDPKGMATAVDVFASLAAQGYADTPKLLDTACAKVALTRATRPEALTDDPEWAKDFRL